MHKKDVITSNNVVIYPLINILKDYNNVKYINNDIVTSNNVSTYPLIDVLMMEGDGKCIISDLVIYK